MGVVEVYACLPGQALPDGRMETSLDIGSKDDAASDATRRFACEPRLAKVAYYKLKDDGGFKLLLAVDNPAVAKTTPKMAKPLTKTGAKIRSKPKAKSFWGRLFGAA